MNRITTRTEQLNHMLAVVLIVLQLLAFFGLPRLGLSTYWLLMPLLLGQNTLWALIHEAIHGHFCAHPKRNQRWGRILSVILGASFFILRFGHLMHHRFNRAWESEHYDAQKTTWWRAAPWHYFYLFGGLYLVEVLMTALAILLPDRVLARFVAQHSQKIQQPELVDIAARTVRSKRQRQQIAVDGVAILLFFGAAFWVWGEHWGYLLAFIWGRGLMISLVDNVYHYATPKDNSQAAWELKLPQLLSYLLLHGNYHNTHHLSPAVPWTGLPEAHQEKQLGFKGGFGRAILKQMYGPIPLGLDKSH